MQFWDQLVEGLESIGSAAADWIPRIAVALLVLIVGRWILGLIRKWVAKLLGLPAVNSVFDRAGINGALEPSGTSPAKLTATVLYAVLMVGLWLIVFNILQVDAIVSLLERLLAWIPLVLVAAVVVIVAAAVGNWVADLIRPFADQRQVGWLPGAVRVGIVVFGALAAFDILDIRFAEDIVKILTVAAGLAFAVAFGVGGIDTAKQWWSRYLTPRQEQGFDRDTHGGHE
ncbi:MAG: hypothetical protein HKN46_07205 [Acidimicrobiia bacterium]|nr:hypothetical protein [Acidimicrobiia bacterium]